MAVGAINSPPEPKKGEVTIAFQKAAELGSNGSNLLLAIKAGLLTKDLTHALDTQAADD
jgi:hypothetical protein